jgi:hypothetical protein
MDGHFQSQSGRSSLIAWHLSKRVLNEQAACRCSSGWQCLEISPIAAVQLKVQSRLTQRRGEEFRGEPKLDVSPLGSGQTFHSPLRFGGIVFLQTVVIYQTLPKIRITLE